MAEGKKSFIVYTSWKIWLDGLTFEQKGQWLDWMLNYTNDKKPKFPDDQAVKIACMMAQDTLKRDLKKYEARCERMKTARNQNPNNNKELDNNLSQSNNRQLSVNNQSNISSDNDNVNDNDNDNVNDNEDTNVSNKKKESKEKSPTSRFIPPTLEQVKAYCDERRNLVDPNKWFDFYQSKGWMVGKNKMKDWKAAVRTWEQTDGFRSDSDDDNGGFEVL